MKQAGQVDGVYDLPHFHRRKAEAPLNSENTGIVNVALELISTAERRRPH